MVNASLATTRTHVRAAVAAPPHVLASARASFEFGHFDAIYDMGTRHLLGRVPGRPRNVDEALRFLAPSASGGGWGRRVRQVMCTVGLCVCVCARLNLGRRGERGGGGGVLSTAFDAPSSDQAPASKKQDGDLIPRGSPLSFLPQGFDAVLAKAPVQALLLYLEGSELGFEVAASNAAYLLDFRHVDQATAAAGLLLLPDPDQQPQVPALPAALSPASPSEASASGAASAAAGATFGYGSSAAGGGGGAGSLSLGAKFGQWLSGGWLGRRAAIWTSPLGGSATTTSGGGGGAAGEAAAASRLVDDASALWALHFHRRAAESGSPEAFVAVGDAHFYGRGVDSLAPAGGGGQPNYEAALWWYSKAATAGVAQGAFALGHMYERGLGCVASEARAERHYAFAAELLDAEKARREASGRVGFAAGGVGGAGRGGGANVVLNFVCCSCVCAHNDAFAVLLYGALYAGFFFSSSLAGKHVARAQSTRVGPQIMTAQGGSGSALCGPRRCCGRRLGRSGGGGYCARTASTSSSPRASFEEAILSQCPARDPGRARFQCRCALVVNCRAVWYSSIGPSLRKELSWYKYGPTEPKNRSPDLPVSAPRLPPAAPPSLQYGAIYTREAAARR